jgi:hypothetical protein
MTSRHRTWRSSGGLVLAAAPWAVIFSGIVALVVLLVVTLWSGLGRDSSRAGRPGANGPGEQFPPSLPSPAPSLPSSLPPPPSLLPGPGGAAPPPAPGPAGDAPARTTTAARTRPAASAPAVTSAGAPTLRNAYAVLQAESFDARSGGTVVTCDEGGRAVSALADGDWIRYDDVDFGSSRAIDFVARVASGLTGGGSGLVQIRLDSPSSTPIGDFAIDNTGGWQAWRSVPGNVTGPTGVHTVYLTFSSAQPADFVAVNWLTFRT